MGGWQGGREAGRLRMEYLISPHLRASLRRERRKRRGRDSKGG